MSCKSGQLWKEFSMYFLPLCELESYSASNYLKENVKLVREIELPVVVAPNYSVCESDGNLLVFLTIYFLLQLLFLILQMMVLWSVLTKM